MSNPRLLAIDVARGVAVLAMIQTHAYDGWVIDGERAELAFRVTRVIGTLPLPMFLLLAGMGLALRASADEARGVAPQRTRMTVMVSGLKVILAGYGLSALYALINGARNIEALLRADVLHAIGLSLLVLAGLGIGSPRRLLATAMVLTLLPVALCPVLTTLAHDTPVSWWRHLVGLMVEVPGVSHMPLVPLLSFCAIGVGTGLWLSRSTRLNDDEMRRKWLHLAALGGVLTLIGVVSSDWARTAGITISRSHPSIALNVIDLDGRALLALGCSALSLPFLGVARSVLVACGRHSLFLYGLHLPFCYGRLAQPFHRDLSMAQASLLVLTLVTFCIAAALALEHLRLSRARKHPIS